MDEVSQGGKGERSERLVAGPSLAHQAALIKQLLNAWHKLWKQRVGGWIRSTLKAGLETTGIGVKIGGRIINNLRYADDTTILAESEAELKELLMRIKEASLKQVLRLNIRKTKIMSTGNLTKFDLDGEEIEKVNQFTFLGSLVTADGGCRSEIRRRLALERSAMNGLRNIIHDKEVQ